MYRKVTTLINFAAFVVFWIIMLLFTFLLIRMVKRKGGVI